MNQILLLNLSSTLFPVIHFFIFSSFFLAKKALAVDKNFTICSEPSTCGRHNIKFPFFIQERRCGYPGFNIFCRNSTDPILSLPDGDYIIHDIFYQNQSFRVSKAVAFDGDAVCSHSIANLSIPEDRLSLPPNQTEILFLFNCNLTMPWTWELSQYKVYCSAENETNATLALFNNDPKLNSASKSCKKTVVAPVAFYEGERGVENMLNRGFVLKWIASNCSICEASGGKCGFDYSTYHFKCFCPDRPHAWHCRPDFSVRKPLPAAPGNVVKVALVHWDEFEQQPVSLVASPVQFERENNQTITSVDYIKLLTMDLLSTGRMDMLVLSAKEVVPIVDSMRDLVSVSALMDLIPEL
ncbi:hypothetical protein POUND7_015553 [Theobroma cacao]